MSLKHVLMIATGGTLACRETGRGLAPSLTGEQLIEFLPELPKICKVVVENPFSIDSTDITTADRVKLAGIIRENYDLYDGFVIAHGTDTLGYTSALLYHMLRNLNKPVILTGAQKPIGVPGSDAERNLLDAFRVIRAGYVGVAAVLHGQIIRGNHVVKVDCESMNAFRSINAPLAGTIDREGNVRLDIVPKLGGEPEFVEDIDSDFVLLKLVPISTRPLSPSCPAIRRSLLRATARAVSRFVWKRLSRSSFTAAPRSMSPPSACRARSIWISTRLASVPRPWAQYRSVIVPSRMPSQPSSAVKFKICKEKSRIV